MGEVLYSIFVLSLGGLVLLVTSLLMFGLMSLFTTPRCNRCRSFFTFSYEVYLGQDPLKQDYSHFYTKVYCLKCNKYTSAYRYKRWIGWCRTNS